MTLDSWLSRASPSPPPPGPPAKRQRTDVASRAPSPSDSPRGMRLTSTKLLSHDARTAMLAPPELVLGRRSLRAWYASRGFYDPAYPYSLACLPDSPHAVIGLETGDLHVVQCGAGEAGLYDPAVGRATAVLPSVGTIKSPARAVAAPGGGRVLCTSDTGVHCVDLVRPDAPTLVASVFDVAHLGVRGSGPVVAYGTAAGAVGLLDPRAGTEPVREWADAHSVLAGPRAQRVRHGVTALAFFSDNVVASASNSNECVKFWDARAASTKRPVHATAAFSTHAYKSGAGIVALAPSVTDPTRALWALKRSGELLKIDAGLAYPQYVLDVPSLRVNSLYASIDVIPNMAPRAPKTGHRAPEWPFVACGGEGGVTLVSEPSAAARKLHVDATVAARLPCAADVTRVRWHPYTNELVTLSDDSACRLWALRPGHKVPAQFLPSRTERTAHRPRRAPVIMQPVLYY